MYKTIKMLTDEFYQASDNLSKTKSFLFTIRASEVFAFGKLFIDLGVLNIFDILSPKEKEIINYRFGINGCEFHTLEDTAKKFGFTRERIRQIEAKILQVMRDSIQFKDRGGQIKKDTYIPVENMFRGENYSCRVLNSLINSGCGSIEQLIQKTEKELSNFRGMGKVGIKFIKDWLSKNGLSLKQ